MDSDSSYKFEKSNFKDINKTSAGLNRLRKQNKYNQKISKQKEILDQLRFVAESMRKAGATEQSIYIAVKGMYEF
jgi:hypothetical protein